MHPCPIRFPERKLKEPLVDYDGVAITFWAELVALVFVVPLFFLLLGFVAWQPKLDR